MTQATDLEHEVPLKAVEALRADLGERLVAVVLFGSRARGDTDPSATGTCSSSPRGYRSIPGTVTY